MKSFRSCAKLNLHLEVLRRRSDGFHDLRTVFRTLDLADELRVDRIRRGGIELRVEGADLPDDRRNLAWRAAAAFLGRWGGPGSGVRLELVKRIPVAGGLGGGSGNAATVLLALAELYGIDPEDSTVGRELARLAAGIGADVPYFLVGGTALGTGRGDRLTPLAELPARPEPELRLAVPPFGVATSEVFARVEPAGERPAFPALARALAGGAVAWPELVGANDLEAPAFAARPELSALYTGLVRAGASAVRLSGSGSTVFALFDDSKTAQAAAEFLPSGCAWLQVSTLDRRLWRRFCGFGSFEGGS